MTDEEKEKWEPVDTVSLGRSTWTFLHTLAASFPNKPTPVDRTRMMMFMLNFSELYPCEICRSGLKDIVAKSPPEVESRRAFTQWMCRVHNEVNVHLGKEVFDCAKVAERWGICESCQLYKEDLDVFKKLMKSGMKKPE